LGYDDRASFLYDRGIEVANPQLVVLATIRTAISTQCHRIWVGKVTASARVVEMGEREALE
jgi:hypothetical protein